jgi:hypothetical protein
MISGAMYRGVPSMAVEVVCPVPWVMRATPKSETFGTVPSPESSRRMLAGLTSRWMIPSAWIAARPSAISRPHVSPADVLHDDAQRAALDHEVAHPHDVAVHHAQEDGSLLDEPADDLRVLGVLGPEELDRDPLAVVVAGPRPDRSHRAATDLGVEPVAAAEGASGHGTSFDRVGG